jgi:hypothetical protein
MSTPGGTTARFTKRKHYQGSEADVEEVEEEVEQIEDERPRKKQNTLKDQLFREEVQKRLAEKKLARAKELAAAKQVAPSSPAQLRKSVVLYGPGQSEQPASHTPVAATVATPQRIPEQQQPQEQQPQQELQQHHQPQQYAQPPQHLQLQPLQAPAQTPQRGFLGRLIETISPFKRRPQTPSSADIRTGPIQLQQQTRLQHPLNNELNQVMEQEEHKTPRARE